MLRSLHHSIQGQRPKAELSPSDIDALLEGGLITRQESLHPEAARALPIRTFTVTESAKKRRRWITHTASTNHYPPGLSLKRGSGPAHLLPVYPTEATQKVHYKCAACIDFAAYFHQFGLDETHWYFSLRGDKDKWFLTTIPTGSNFSPALAQVFSVALATLAVRRANCIGTVHSEVYIDNVRFSGENEADIQKVVSTMYEVADSTQITINENQQEVIDLATCRGTYTFLGVQYDHPRKAVALSEKLRQKILDIPDLEGPPQWTLRQYLSAYGCLGYATLVHRGCRAPYYHATKFLRRRVNKMLDSPANIWPIAWAELKKWRQWALAQGWRIVPQPNNPQIGLGCTIFTDASNVGLGVVLFSHVGGVDIIARPWQQPAEFSLTINVKEAIAVKFALTTLDLRRYANITLRIDNTSTIGALKKSHSGSWMLNRQILEILESPAWTKVLTFTYVRSAENHADLPSRLNLALAMSSAENPLLWANFKRHFQPQQSHRLGSSATSCPAQLVE